MGTHTRRWLVLAGLVLAVSGVVTGCSGGESAQDASGGQSVAGDVGAVTAEGRVPGGAQGGAQGGKPGSADGLSTVNRPAVTGRAVIRRGTISIVTDEMNRARLGIEDLLAEHGGYLASEDTDNDRRGRPERSVLVLRVPEPSFDEVMSELSELGRTKRAERSSQDVTTELVDVDSRVATQEASLARLRGFLREATDVEDMIRVESEIARRQADLESLKAQQKYLRDNTAMSTVTVRLSTPPAAAAPEPRRAGFLVGLGEGWSALWAVLVGLATVAGAVLPFAVALAVAGVPLWLLVRAVRRRHSGPEPAAPDAG